MATLRVAYWFSWKKCLIVKIIWSKSFFEKYFEFGKKNEKGVWGINVMDKYSNFHQDQKGEKHIKWGAKKVSGREEEGEDTSPRSILGQFKTVIESKWISKWG